MTTFIVISLIAVGVFAVLAYIFRSVIPVVAISSVGTIVAVIPFLSFNLAFQMVITFVCSVIYGLILFALSDRKTKPKLYGALSANRSFGVGEGVGNQVVVNKKRANPHLIAGYSFVASLIACGFVYQEYQFKINYIHDLQKEYPVVSLENRLAYENESDNSSHRENTVIQLNSELEAQLVSHEMKVDRQVKEDNESYQSRTKSLSLLHQKAEKQFLRAPGFGVFRGPSIAVSAYAIELPQEEPIPLPVVPHDYPANDFQYDPATGEFPLAQKLGSTTVPRPLPPILTKMHIEGKGIFFDPNKNGYVKNKKHVVGFRGHNFSRRYQLDSYLFDAFSQKVEPSFMHQENEEAKEQTNGWKIHQLQLVSLLKHKQPVIYSTPTLPDMEDLKNVKTRSLDRFEKMALQKLYHEEDVVINSGTNHIQMMGSLRASKDCLTCHSVKRGELLGAFSYRLFRVKPIRK